MSIERLKRAAAEQALNLVKPGMRLGLGTGSTARHFVDLLGIRVAAGLNVIGVPTSEATRAQAESLSIPLTTLDETPELDLTIDGADELDSNLRLIKGNGAALLREKIVAAASKRMIVIADASKRVSQLGKFPLPVEVDPFGLESTRRAVIRACGGRDVVRLRRKPDGSPLATDGGHFIVDCALGAIADPEGLSAALHAIPGVVEHGLFLGLCSTAYIATPDGVAVLEARA